MAKRKPEHLVGLPTTKRPRLSLLPSDVVFEVLLRLPVKTLCKLSCVSKSWHALIHDPYFRSTYRSRSKHHPRLFASVGHSRPTDKLRFYSFDSRGTLVSKSSSLISSQYETVASCLELACMYKSVDGEMQRVCICNPTTGDSILLPEEETCANDESGEHVMFAVSFGFVPSTEEYKVVRVFYRNGGCCSGSFGTEVFGLRVGDDGVCRAIGEGWREVSDPPFGLLNVGEAFVDGAVYFRPNGLLARGTRSSSRARFDLEREEWSVIPLHTAASFVVKSLARFDGLGVGKKLSLESDEHYAIGYNVESFVSFCNQPT